MTILIDTRSGEPIYEQIFAQVKNQILMGTLARDEALPSIRALAKDLRVSVITTKRAYDELESAGLIYTLPGKGSFAAATNRTLLRREHTKEIEKLLLEVKALAAQGGISDRELWELYEKTHL